MRHLRAGLAIALVMAGASQATEVLYTWTDAEGKVHYSDRPPKGFTGAVKRIDIDTPPTPSPAPARAAPKPAPEAREEAPVPADMNAKRRANRERLDHELSAARAKLAAARKALAEHQEPEVDERQIVQRPGAAPNAAPMPGLVPPATRMNCRIEERGGKKVSICPVSMPSEAYYDRIAGLQAAVKDAEEEVAAAERAYRRGVD